MPSDFAAASRVCPAITTISGSTTIGCRHPNSRRLFATLVMAATFLRGLPGYGLTLSVATDRTRIGLSSGSAVRAESEAVKSRYI